MPEDKPKPTRRESCVHRKQTYRFVQQMQPTHCFRYRGRLVVAADRRSHTYPLNFLSTQRALAPALLRWPLITDTLVSINDVNALLRLPPSPIIISTFARSRKSAGPRDLTATLFPPNSRTQKSASRWKVNEPRPVVHVHVMQHN